MELTLEIREVVYKKISGILGFLCGYRSFYHRFVKKVGLGGYCLVTVMFKIHKTKDLPLP